MSNILLVTEFPTMKDGAAGADGPRCAACGDAVCGHSDAIYAGIVPAAPSYVEAAAEREMTPNR